MPLSPAQPLTDPTTTTPSPITFTTGFMNYDFKSSMLTRIHKYVFNSVV